MKLPLLNIHDYSYELPDERIAKYPPPQRDQSKLLVYQAGEISHNKFYQLPDLLPDNSLLFFNDTKVIPARILFEKETGANIEVLLLSPVTPSSIVSVALTSREKTSWKCTIGNLKRWPEKLVLRRELEGIILSAQLLDRDTGIVEFSWTPRHLAFAEIIQWAGAVPLPPYLKRDAEDSDRQRYQTVYSHFEGAVAAPTAGLHFTQTVLRKLRKKGIISDFLTLHVSAGTFLPVKVENATDHTMHEEQIIIRKENIKHLLMSGKKVIAVGTTALRTLESLYWYGTMLLDNPQAPFIINSLQPYQKTKSSPTLQDSLNAVFNYMEVQHIEELTGHTSIYIFPGYSFKVCQGLITNFHQPGSTLLLLIAAWLGPSWKKVYENALNNDYRFLSYGDSSLLLPK